MPSITNSDKYPAISQKILKRKEDVQMILNVFEELKDVSQLIESEYSPSDAEYSKTRKTMQDLDKVARDLVNLTQSIELQNEALSKFKNVSQIDVDAKSQFQKFVQNAKKNHGPLSNDKIFKSKMYQTYYEVIRRIHNPDERMPWQNDDDLIVANTGEVSLECSITMSTFVDPMKGPCGHTYSKEGILGLFQSSMSSTIKCPVAGCSCKFSQFELEPDIQMRAILERQQRRTMNTSSTKNSFLLLDDDIES